MHLDEHQFEQAAANEQAERDRAIAAARSAGHEDQIRDGTGRIVCLGCYEPLSAARLQAKPDAARCVDCATLRERWGR